MNIFIVVIKSLSPKINQSNESSSSSTTGYNSKTTIQLKEGFETSSTSTISKSYLCWVCLDSILNFFLIFSIFYWGEGIGTQQLYFTERDQNMIIRSYNSNIGTRTILVAMVSKLYHSFVFMKSVSIYSYFQIFHFKIFKCTIFNLENLN